MNEAVALAPQNVGTAGLDDLLALVGFPSKRKVAGELSDSVEGALKGIFSLLDEMLLSCVASQTEDEFINARAKVIRTYAKAVTSLAAYVHLVVPSKVIERITDESFCEFESEFRNEGLGRFGAPVRDQAIFTIWTLRRTSRLIAKIAIAGEPTKEQSEEAVKLTANFISFTTWTQFHLDCLLAAIRFDKTVQMPVLPQIIEGLRAAVNAYGYAREGLNLRMPEIEPEITPQAWDEEDQELLNSSMRDMEKDLVDDPWQPETETSSPPLTITAKEVETTVEDSSQPHEATPIFGTHIREGIEIIKDWAAERKQ